MSELIEYTDGVYYRMYAGPELKRVAEKIVEWGYPAPNPLLTIAFTAEDSEEEILGCVAIQAISVIEPLAVREGFRGNGIGDSLMRVAEKYIKESAVPRVYAHTASPAIRMRLEAMGAREHPDTLFEWRR